MLASDVLYCQEALGPLSRAGAACLAPSPGLSRVTEGTGSAGCDAGGTDPAPAMVTHPRLFLLCHVPRCRITPEDIVSQFSQVGLQVVSPQEWPGTWPHGCVSTCLAHAVAIRCRPVVGLSWLLLCGRQPRCAVCCFVCCALLPSLCDAVGRCHVRAASAVPVVVVCPTPAKSPHMYDSPVPACACFW